MASAQDRKRAPADDISQEHSPNKKLKPRGQHHRPSNFPPEFWDNLSKVPLTCRALREHDRRNSARPAPRPAAPSVHTTDRARFARYGGPDLRHLRGCPEPKGVNHTMASRRSSGSRRTQSTRSTNATSLSAESGTSSAYGPEFETHLTDHEIYIEGYEYPEGRSTPEPGNQAHQDLSVARPSLSPSCFSESKFRDFRRKDARATVENDIMATVVPIICGDVDISSRQNVLFTELAPITSTYGDVGRPKPDLFDGAHIGDIDKNVRDPKGDIYPLIIPTKHASFPVAPNFFLEAKAPNKAADVLKRQACYFGAYGARAMHALQNYGDEEPTYDGNAYAFSSTYYAGTLKLYAQHPTPPTTPGGRPEYHMTQLRGFGMTDTREKFIQGATVFRNARDWAQRHRNSFIQAANARARQSGVEAPP